MTRQEGITDRDKGLLIESCDLVVDRIYEGGRSGNAADDRLSSLLGVSNQGGFRYLGRPGSLKLIVLISSFVDPDWPDHLDLQTGILTYFGDNKSPGRALHDTPRKGNLLLREIFEHLHRTESQRHRVPPILAFRKTGRYRDVKFLGLAAPGVEGMPATEDLVAVWRTSAGNRFQNYKASFTILDVPVIKRAWLEDVRAGGCPVMDNAPSAWRTWSRTGRYTPLTADPTIEYRKKDEQLPDSRDGAQAIKCIIDFYQDDPIGFERCAAEIVRMMDRGFIEFDLTRPSRDGGRDAVGYYRIGTGASSVLVDVAMEAKCYNLQNGVGVKEMARLISRLRHRQLGVMVTTSYVAPQAYREVKEDGHPIAIICARDISNVLRQVGITGITQTRQWLDSLETPQC